MNHVRLFKSFCYIFLLRLLFFVVQKRSILLFLCTIFTIAKVCLVHRPLYKISREKCNKIRSKQNRKLIFSKVRSVFILNFGLVWNSLPCFLLLFFAKIWNTKHCTSQYLRNHAIPSHKKVNVNWPYYVCNLIRGVNNKKSVRLKNFNEKFHNWQSMFSRKMNSVHKLNTVNWFDVLIFIRYGYNFVEIWIFVWRALFGVCLSQRMLRIFYAHNLLEITNTVLKFNNQFPFMGTCNIQVRERWTITAWKIASYRRVVISAILLYVYL